MDQRLKFFGVFRCVGKRAIKKEGQDSDSFYITFTFEGGTFEVMFSKAQADTFQIEQLYDVQGVMEPVTYTVNYQGQVYTRQAFRINRVLAIKAVK